MPATTTLLGLVTPTQGTLSGTWGDTVNYGITDYVDISVAGTLTLTGDGAVTLANTTGSSSGNSITSTLAGAGTVTAQFAIVKVTGTLTVAKVVTGPSYSKTYTVVNSATGGIVTFKASGQTGVSIAVGETAFVYFNGTDYVKVSGTVAVASFQTSLGGLTPSTATTGVVTLAGTLNTTSGGTGLTSFTAGDVPYYASGSVLSKLAIGTAGQFLTSTGTAPQWSTLSGVAVTTFSAGTTGFTPSSATSGAVTLAGTLATTNGGTGLTSFTSGGVVYASSSSALATGSALTFNGTQLTVDVAGTSTTSTIFLGARTSGGSSVRLVTTQNSDGTATFDSDAGGNGTPSFIFKNSGTEGMRLTSTGLGIGTSSPVSKLNVNGGSVTLAETTTGTYNIDFQSRTASTNARIQYDQVSNTTGQLLFYTNGGSLTERVKIDSSGIVTMSAYGAGAATFSAAGVISSVSDETWKIKDGVPVDTDAMLQKLEPGYWYYNDEKKETFGSDRQLGFYAQNVNSAIGPEAAPEPEEGKPWGYYDRSVLAVTVMSLQKALVTIESLKARLDAANL